MNTTEQVRTEVLRFLAKNPSTPNEELENAVTKRINRIRTANNNRPVGRKRLHGHLYLMGERGLITRDRQGLRFLYSITDKGRQLLKEVAR